MKTFILWLMGDNLGIALINIWQWLWQIPIEETPSPQPQTSDKLALQHAQQLLDSIALRVTQMQGAVEKVRNSTREIQRQYELKNREYQELIRLVSDDRQSGNTDEARLKMAKLIVIERVLPELKKALENSHYRLMTVEQSHTEEQSKLALLEIEMQNIKACMAMNESVGNNRGTDDLNSLQERFRDVQTEIEDRFHQIKIMSQLSDSSNCLLQETLTPQDLDDRIAKLPTN